MLRVAVVVKKREEVIYFMITILTKPKPPKVETPNVPGMQTPQSGKQNPAPRAKQQQKGPSEVDVDSHLPRFARHRPWSRTGTPPRSRSSRIPASHPHPPPDPGRSPSLQVHPIWRKNLLLFPFKFQDSFTFTSRIRPETSCSTWSREDHATPTEGYNNLYKVVMMEDVYEDIQEHFTDLGRSECRRRVRTPCKQIPGLSNPNTKPDEYIGL